MIADSAILIERRGRLSRRRRLPQFARIGPGLARFSPRGIATCAGHSSPRQRGADMSKLPGNLTHAEAGVLGFAWQTESIDAWWCRRREASLNWLALGLLLAAWNASEDDPARAPRRP